MRWLSSGLTLLLGLTVLVAGSELAWRGAARSLARLREKHWSERARVWFAWRSAVFAWRQTTIVGICLVDFALAPRTPLSATLRMVAVTALLSTLLLAPRTERWSARVVGVRPRALWRAATAFHALFLSSLWLTLLFCSAIPPRYDAAGIAWALLLLSLLLLNGLGAPVRVWRLVGMFRPARPEVVEAVRRAREQPEAGPAPHVLEVDLGVQANAVAYPAAQTVVFTTAAVEALAPAELSAIAAHELAHLRESRPTRALRAAWSAAFALPVLFIPAMPHAPARAIILGTCLFVVSAVAYRFLSHRLEQQADTAAASHHVSAAYASALERLHELNLTPAVLRGRQTHPHLYDRLIASGVTPTFPRPRPPPAWPALVASFVGYVGCGVLAIAQIALVARVGARFDVAREDDLSWAVALKGEGADWSGIAGHWLAQGRLEHASLALDIAERREASVLTRVLRASIAARRGDCPKANSLLAKDRLKACGDPDICMQRFLGACEDECESCEGAYLAYAQLLRTCQGR